MTEIVIYTVNFCDNVNNENDRIIKFYFFTQKIFNVYLSCGCQDECQSQVHDLVCHAQLIPQTNSYLTFKQH